MSFFEENLNIVSFFLEGLWNLCISSLFLNKSLLFPSLVHISITFKELKMIEYDFGLFEMLIVDTIGLHNTKKIDVVFGSMLMFWCHFIWWWWWWQINCQIIWYIFLKVNFWALRNNSFFLIQVQKDNKYLKRCWMLTILFLCQKGIQKKTNGEKSACITPFSINNIAIRTLKMSDKLYKQMRENKKKGWINKPIFWNCVLFFQLWEGNSKKSITHTFSLHSKHNFITNDNKRFNGTILSIFLGCSMYCRKLVPRTAFFDEPHIKRQTMSIIFDTCPLAC